MQFRLMYRTAARQSYREGTIDSEQYKILMDALRQPRRRNPRTCERVDVMEKVEEYTYANMPCQSIDWAAIIQWLKENWQTILKLIVSLVMIFLEPAP